MRARYAVLIAVIAVVAVMLGVRARDAAQASPLNFSTDFATVNVTNAQVASYTWAASTTDPRALQKIATSDRIAAAYYSPNWLEIDVNIADGQTHRMAMYCLDWDSNARAQTVEERDYATGTLLDSGSISSFHSGVYLVFSVSGHVVFRVTRTAGADAVVSGIYFGGALVTPTPTPRPCARLLPNGKCKK